MFHHMVTLALDGRLYLAPISGDSALRVLDIGTGTGIWAMEMGDNHPSYEIRGNDLSPIQPPWVPVNVSFEVDDCESPWPQRPPFDFIHSRYMAGSIADWPRLIRRCHAFVALAYRLPESQRHSELTLIGISKMAAGWSFRTSTCIIIRRMILFLLETASLRCMSSSSRLARRWDGPCVRVSG